MSALRPTVLTSDLNVIESNMRIVRRFCGNGPRQIAVVKADAYGHGAVAVSKRLLRCGADELAVATIDEAVELREAGVAAPILILGGSTDEALIEAAARDVCPAVYDERALKVLAGAARSLGHAVAAHLKVDTGMSRIGARGQAALESLLDAWRAEKGVRMAGMFTHLAAADDPDFTETQLSAFDGACALAEAAGFRPMRHAAASEGIARGPRAWYDAVRPGIVLYGCSVSGLFPGIEPAQTLTTRPVRLARIAPGETVGYGRTFTAGRDTLVMTLPIGYGDGYPRALGNKADVLVRGRRAKVVGRVCMDQIMVDVTDIPGVGMDDEVVLMGRQGDERVTPDELAALVGTIPYEIILGFSQRVTRVVKE